MTTTKNNTVSADNSHPWILRWVKPKKSETLPIQLHRKRVYVLPTRFGFAFSVLLLILLLGGLNYANNLILMQTFLLSGVVLVALIQVNANLIGLSVVAVHTGRCFAGDSCQMEIDITASNKRLRRAVAVQLNDIRDIRDVSNDKTSRFKIAVTTPQRGLHPAPRLRVRTEFPFGFFYAWAWIQPKSMILVYPKPEAKPPSAPFSGTGTESHHVIQGEQEPSGIRNYRTGDPPRLIAWKASARNDQLLSKELGATHSTESIFNFQQVSHLPLELGISRLCAWVIRAHQQGLRFGIQIPGFNLEAGEGEHHLHQALKALALHGTRN